MQKFSNFKYIRPNLEEIGAKAKEIVKVLSSEEATLEDQIKAVESYFELSKEIYTSQALSSARFSINTNDEYYKGENTWFDANSPLIMNIDFQIKNALVSSPRVVELEKKFGKHFFTKVRTELRLFDPKIIPLLQKENELVTKHGELKAKAIIHFDGKDLTIPQVTPYYQSPDREVRKAAYKAVSDYFESTHEEYDDIYDQLVHIRDEKAKALGFKNFIQFAYLNMGRTDYTAKDVSKFRAKVQEYLTPFSTEIYKNNTSRIGISDPKFYDLSLVFSDGNPKPIGGKDVLTNAAVNMYNDMSKETGKFIQLMTSKELFDLESKPGKMGGGYCTYFPTYNVPFIFANFNGTAGDADVFTHECGHAFAAYSNKNKNPFLKSGEMETAEIHSMSMEFFAHPYIEAFFGDDATKYRYQHLQGTVNFIPYGALVDAYQEWVYTHINAKPKERNAKWRELEKAFIPARDYAELSYLDSGTFWYRQPHIFEVPFYYIDYCIAQVCAMQYFIWSLENKEDAWKSYYKLCKLAGTIPFKKLLKKVGIQNPLKSDVVAELIPKLKAQIEKYKSEIK